MSSQHENSVSTVHNLDSSIIRIPPSSSSSFDLLNLIATHTTVTPICSASSHSKNDITMAEEEITTIATKRAMPRTATAAERFNFFLMLPREIQDLIWEFACQQAVETFLKGPLFSIKDWWKNTNYTWIAYHPHFGWNPYVLDVYRLPKFGPLLHVCRYSRLVALTWWKCVTKDAVVLSPDTGEIHRDLMDRLKEKIADVRARIDREEREQTRL